MAHIFYGNARYFVENADVVDAATRLDDRYWCLFEFDIPGANIDLLTIRPGDTGLGFSTFLMTEVKHFSGTITGATHGQWSIERGGKTGPFRVSNPLDMNPWDQAVRAHDRLEEYLERHRGDFLDLRSNDASINVWPQLLLVRNDGPGVHMLPAKPPSFGDYLFSLQRWLQRAEEWTPKMGRQVTAAEVEALTKSLGLTRWDPVALPIATSAISRRPVPVTTPAPKSAAPVAIPAGDPRLEEMLGIISEMNERMKAVEESLKPQPTPTETFSWKRFISGRS